MVRSTVYFSLVPASGRLRRRDGVLNAELARRARAYADAVVDLGQAMALTGVWAPPAVAHVAKEAIADVAASRERMSGRTAWLDLYVYPATLLFYAYGLGALAGERYENLAGVFGLEVRGDRDVPRAAVESSTTLLLLATNRATLARNGAATLAGERLAVRGFTAHGFGARSVRLAIRSLVRSIRDLDRSRMHFGRSRTGDLRRPDGPLYLAGSAWWWGGRVNSRRSLRHPAAQALADRFRRSPEELADAGKRYTEIVARARRATF